MPPETTNEVQFVQYKNDEERSPEDLFSIRNGKRYWHEPPSVQPADADDENDGLFYDRWVDDLNSSDFTISSGTEDLVGTSYRLENTEFFGRQLLQFMQLKTRHHTSTLTSANGSLYRPT